MKLPYTPEYTKKELEKIRQDEAREEKMRFFNRPESMADFSYWSKMVYWTTDEAVALLLGRDPERVSWDKVKSYDTAYQGSPFAKEYARLRKLVMRKWGDGHHAPAMYLDWAGETGIDVPPELITTDCSMTKTDQRIEKIIQAITMFDYEPMSIPDGGKARITKYCMEKYADLFKTKSTFDGAWKQGKKRKPQPFEVKNLESYKKR